MTSSRELGCRTSQATNGCGSSTACALCPTFERSWGGCAVSKLKQAVFDDYHDWRINKVKKGAGHRTTDLDILTLSAALTWVVRKGRFETYPAENDKRYVDPRKLRHAKDVAFTSMDEAHAYAGELMRNPRGESAAWQLLFATTTGQRSEELLQMRLDADPVFGGKLLASKEQFLIPRAGQIGEQPVPVHLGNVNQPSARISTVDPPHKPLCAGSVGQFDLTDPRET